MDCRISIKNGTCKRRLLIRINPIKINILILRKENYMVNANQSEEPKMIERQFTILSAYINETEEDKGQEKVAMIGGGMAVSALNIIRNYMDQLKAQIACSDFGIDPIPKDKQEIFKNNIEMQYGVNTELSKSQLLIANTCDEIKEMLLEKNRKYGDSALNPQRIFSKANPIEQINVRIDDKLSRIKSAQTDEDEDVESDLLGYLILKKVAKKILQIKNSKEVISENH